MTTRPSAPPPLDMANAFAHRTMSERVPRILRVVRTDRIRPPSSARWARCAGLLTGCRSAAFRRAVPPPDYADWTDLHRELQARISR